MANIKTKTKENKWFKTVQYARGLKIARVVAIRKREPKDNINNYRPISILSTINKVVERYIYDRMNMFLIKKQFFLRHQHDGRRTVHKDSDMRVC